MTPEREAYVKKLLEIDKDRYSQTLNIKINEFEPGKLEAETRVTEDHINTIGSAHGGFLFSFCDKAGGYCAGSTGMGGPTITANISYLQPALLGDTLICKADVIHAGETTAAVDVTVYNKDTGTVNCRAMFHYARKFPVSMDSADNLGKTFDAYSKGSHARAAARKGKADA